MDQYISNYLTEDISNLTIQPREEEKSYPARISHGLKIQYILIDTLPLCRQIWASITSGSIAIDIEGVQLCRTGQVCIIQLLVEKDPVVKLFDIVTLGERAFEEGGLRRVLESKDITKVMYDPRADADALYHLHNTTLCNVLDVQVLYQHFCDHKHREPFLKGLKKALEDYAHLKRWSTAYQKQVDATKQLGRELFAPELGGSYEVWSLRPLPTDMIEYSCLDVIHLHGMANLWQKRSKKSKQKFNETVARRIANTINSSNPATGRQMAKRDFN